MIAHLRDSNFGQKLLNNDCGCVVAHYYGEEKTIHFYTSPISEPQYVYTIDPKLRYFKIGQGGMFESHQYETTHRNGCSVVYGQKSLMVSLQKF